MLEVVLYYLLGINVIAFFSYGIDKWKAIHNKWRIKESALITMAMIGGALGALCGMLLFHHKTRKPKFYITIPLCLVVWVAALIYIWQKYNFAFSL